MYKGKEFGLDWSKLTKNSSKKREDTSAETVSSSLSTGSSSSSILNEKLTGDYIRKKIGEKMDLVFERCLANDVDFPYCDSPIWIFGRSFSIHYGKDLDGVDLDELRRRVKSTLWFTYRKNFPPLGDGALSSDRGWGCMIRAGQMVMAKALLLRHIGPTWHWDSNCRAHTYLQIISLFEDVPSAPFSVHRISETGSTLGKAIGSWLGPNTVAQVFKKILSANNAFSNQLDIELVIAMDSTVVNSEIKRSCLSFSPPVINNGSVGSGTYSTFNTGQRLDPLWKPLLLIVPLRLGLSDLNPDYIPAFRAVFEVQQNIGMLGGRPNSALYFIGYAEDEVLYLDPHTVQPTVTIGSKIFETEKLGDETYHVNKPGRMPFSVMDPSIAVCFFCPTEAEFDSLCTKLLEKFRTTPLPLFEICERRPADWMALDSSPETSSSRLRTDSSWISVGASISPKTNMPRSRSTSNSPRAKRSVEEGDDEEFEILG